MAAPHTDDARMRAAGAAAPGWRTLFDAAPEGERIRLALGLELRQREPYDPDDWSPRRTVAVTPRALSRHRGDLSLVARPLRRSDRRSAWVRGDVSWDRLRAGGSGFDPPAVQWLVELATILTAGRRTAGVGGLGEWLTLDDTGSGLLWPHLAAAEAARVTLVPTAAEQTVVLGSRVEIGAELRETADGLLLIAVARRRGEPLLASVIRPLGKDGVYLAGLDRTPLPVVLAPAAVPPPIAALLRAGGTLRIDAADRTAFLADGLPLLVRGASVALPAGISAPVSPSPTAVVSAHFSTRSGRPRVEVALSWSYPGRVRIPWDEPVEDAPRDAPAESGIRAALEAAWRAEVDRPLTASTALSGADAAVFAAAVLPIWRGLPEVRVEGNSPAQRHTELTDEPEIRIVAVETEQADWFDLGVVVSVAGRPVPLGTLIRALARGRRKLLLSDGAYFSLSHPALHRLRDLLAEAAEGDEWATTARLSRHQVDLWADFEDLADVSEPAQSWRALVDGLRTVERVPEAPVPPAVRAELRPYQRAGYDWLAFLWQHGLGGILADDMGLGKTLQLLALAARIRESGPTGAPVLVVAPTSVLGTWREQAARYTPELRLEVRDATARAGGAGRSTSSPDIVLTSYAVLRLDETAFAAQEWSAVILDEAQFVKNPRTRLHRAVAALRARAVYAATGTPMENSLTDLWAILALTAPGLFPSARRFREEYVKPIEQGKVPENVEGGAYRSQRLARLRRRIRPFVLRRTKESVAPELPPKQELELRVALDPAHRALYDRALQRERQKVLGVLDDLDRNRLLVFRSLTLLRLLSLSPALVDDRHAGIPSRKLDALLDALVEVVAEGHRALVFSQFTSFLRLAEERLTAAGIATAYLDGSTRDRARVIDGFRGGSAPAFLISLKAGGFGLTLTEADYVFVLDPWWNPAAEAQAVDRAHRIGQDRSVMVYRLIAADTIEEKVLALQQRKARLFTAVVDDDALFSQELTADDIRGLFAT